MAGTDLETQRSQFVRSRAHDKTVTTTALAGCLVVGTVGGMDPLGWSPFGPVKWLVVSVLAVAGLANSVRLGEGFGVDRRARGMAVAFIVLVAASAALGVDPLYAWIGTADRRFGVLTWLICGATLFVGSALGSRAKLEAWARWVVVAGLLCGIYVSVEWLIDAPIAVSSNTRRLLGPFGSAAYLGAAMCLIVPISAGVALQRSRLSLWRFAALGSCALGGVALIGSGARAAWVGLAAAALAVGIQTRPAPRVIATSVGVVGFIVLLLMPRIGDVVERQHSTTSRLDEWAVASDVIASRPLLGVGPEGYRIAFGGSVGDDYERTYGRDRLPDRAHSGPLDVAAASGLPAAILYVALVGIAAVRAIRRLGEGPVVSGVAAAVVAYAVHGLWLFPLAELDPVFWIAAGAVAWPSSQQANVAARRFVKLSTSVLLIAAGALFVTGVLGVAADRSARAAVDSTSRAAALERARRAVRLRPDVVRYHLLVADLEGATGTLTGIERALDSASKARRLSTGDPVARFSQANLLSGKARITGDVVDDRAAVHAWSSMVADSPSCWRCHLGLGTAAALAGDRARAQSAWERAVQLAPAGDRTALDLLDSLDGVADP